MALIIVTILSSICEETPTPIESRGGVIGGSVCSTGTLASRNNPVVVHTFRYSVNFGDLGCFEVFTDAARIVTLTALLQLHDAHPTLAL